MKMTKKQVSQFIEDPANWEIIPGNQYVRAARLQFAGNTYIRIDEYVCLNYADAFVMQKTEPKFGFRPTGYRHDLLKQDGHNYPISRTQLEEQIYRAAREET